MKAFPFSNILKEDIVNIGVIGTGGRGKWLMKLLRKMENVKLTACCDIIPRHLEEGLAMADTKAKSYKDYRKFLENRDLDAVIISTPLSLHYPMASEALEAGKHVYCEKTMVFTEDEALNLARQADNSGYIFQVGYQHQYNPLYNQLKSMIRNPKLFGSLSHAECYWNRNGNWRRPVFDPQWERIINWRMYREFSGGLMAELSSHQLDIVNWIADELPTKFTGFGGIDYWKDGRETYDNIHVAFDYPSGFKSYYTCLTTNAFEGFKMKFYGTKGTMEVRGEGGHKAFMALEPSQLKQEMVDGIASATMKSLAAGEQIPVFSHGDDEEPTGNALSSFVRCIIYNDPPQSNVANGKNSAICVAMANEAMQTGKVINYTWNMNEVSGSQ